MKLSVVLQGLGLLTASVSAAPTTGAEPVKVLEDHAAPVAAPMSESEPAVLPELPGMSPAPAGVLVERGAKVSINTPAGSIIGTSLLGVESWRGIPFAEPPVGQLRLKPPTAKKAKLSNYDATTLFPPACPQMFVSNDATNILEKVLNTLLDLPILKRLEGQEDCLTVNVQRPAGTKAGDKLPVLFWIFGGGFELGATNLYDGTSLVSFAEKQGQDFIYVAVNYRVAGFGFLPGKEVLADGSANLGLLDQRLALQWVADNIEAFGGDPDKVTIWGESAGAVSVFDQMAMYGGKADYKGKPLFRGAIMNSGSMVPADPVDCPKGQVIYDKVVEEAGCKGKPDTLACLREVPYPQFLEAVNSVPGILSYSSIALSYLPRPDGNILPESPDKLAKAGRYHAVPMIIGDQEDEGTLFALFQAGLSTTEEIADYLQQYFFNSASKEVLTDLVETYDPWIHEGSPFRTGIFNEWYPGFKRLAAMLGDISFTLARRIFLDLTSKAHPDVPAWSYLASYGYGTPIMGTFHATDVLTILFGLLPNNAMRSGRTYYLNFLHNLDPNKGVGAFSKWPLWKEKRDLMWFERPHRNSILKDDFRSDSAKFLEDNALDFYI